MAEEKEDKWLKSLRDKMDDYELMPPDNIWESIDKQLPYTNRQKRFVIGRRVWIAAATLLILVSSVLTLHFTSRDDDPNNNVAKINNINCIKAKKNFDCKKLTADTNLPETKAISSLSSVTNGKMNADKGKNKLKRKHITATSETQLIAQTAQTVSTVYDVPDSTTAVTETPVKTNDIAIRTKQKNTSVRRSADLPPARDGERLMAMSALHTKKYEGTWSVSFGTTVSGNHFADDGNGFDNYSSGNSLSDAYTSENNFENQSNKFVIGYTKIELKHHFPIRIGFTVEKRINRRFGIATGLTGTYLLSTTEDSYLNNDNNQRIYYIGIPIKINYHFFDGQNFSLYWSNGMEAEKCIYARRSGEHLHLDRIQMSVNTSFGAEFVLVPKLSIYAEPGLSYYWGNGTDIETYRTKNPLSLDLHVGLKLNY